MSIVERLAHRTAIVLAAAVAAAAITLVTEPSADASAPFAHGKADRVQATSRGDGCAAHAWPHIPAECIRMTNRLEPAPTWSRTVTVEHRPEPGLSVLTRVALLATPAEGAATP
jgi:hypothetical protein